MERKTRIITLNGEVNEISALGVIFQLLNYEEENEREPIYLYINSEGGSIIHGLAIYDTIHHIHAPVYTVCCGLAASMGAFLLSCGEKGHRFALRHSRILIHQPLIYTNGGSYAKESQIRESAQRLKKNRELLESIMAANCDRPIEDLHAACERDNWMNSEEALAYGLIDGIL